MTVLPCGRWLVVEPLDPPPASSILVAPTPATTSTWARVIATGPQCRLVQAGQEVYLSTLAGVAVGNQLLVPEVSALLRRDN